MQLTALRDDVVVAINSASDHERVLDLPGVVKDLEDDGLLGSDDAQLVLSGLRSAQEVKLHPFEYIASKHVTDLRSGQELTLDLMTQWLAERCGFSHYHIDPLKIDVQAITPLMSHAYATRHQILGVEVHNKREREKEKKVHKENRLKKITGKKKKFKRQRRKENKTKGTKPKRIKQRSTQEKDEKGREI